MPLLPNQRLLHYRLLEPIGEGGMGVVWKALDTALDREIAIKVLPAEVSADTERLVRFEREARVLASLNHPNIATIHGFHEVDGMRFIAMEYVRGEDLSQRLQRGALPLDEALVVAGKIAEALEAAHEQGVVHRDLKPANVVVDGEQVKVLDFGLAKALSPETSSTSKSGMATSPTVTSAQTRDGMVMGTAAYMSPEQARGKAVDKRTDIWAFGCLLYEALTGGMLFAAETVSDTLVFVLSGEPDWAELPTATPPGVRRLLQRCLEKDARRRLRDIGEARVALDDAIAGSGDTMTSAVAPIVSVGDGSVATKPRLPRWVWAVAAIAATGVFLAGWFARPTAPPITEGEPDRTIRRLTYDAGLQQDPDLSPDGNYIAYSTDRAGNLDIEILPLGGGSVNRITTHAADDAQPRWSPDGTRLAFVSARDDEDGVLVSAGQLGPNSTYVTSVAGDIFVMPALGGVATKLIDRGAYPTWSPDSESIAFQSSRDGQWRIWRVPTTGGQPVQLTSGNNQRFDFHPAWSPDGKWIAYASLERQQSLGIFVVPAEGGEPIQVYEGDAVSPAWSADGASFYFASSRGASQGSMNLWRLPFKPGGDLSIRPRRVTLGVDSDVGASLSRDDRMLAFTRLKISPNIWALDVAKRSLRQVTFGDTSEGMPHVSPDGHRLMFQSTRSGSERIWMMDLRSGELQPLSTPGIAADGRWSPDGSRIVYRGDSEAGQRMITIQRWGDASREIVGTAGGASSAGPRWSPDGNRLVASDGDDLWVHTIGGESTFLVENATDGTWSPDGREIAFQRSTGNDHREVWIVPVDGGEPRLVAGGDVHYSHPQWNPADADEILIVIDHLDLGIVRVGSGEVERITAVASSNVLVDFPSWSADGGTIYFTYQRVHGDLYLIEQ